MSNVQLRPLHHDERAAFVEAEVANYAEQQVRDAGWPRDEALERARAELGPVLERELAEAPTKGERVWTAADVDGRTVGWLWVRPLAERTAAFLYQITVAEPVRSRGYGRAMLAALEALLAAEGIEELRLNVFAPNEPARRLYAATGYEEVSRDGPRRHLRKRLAASDAERPSRGRRAAP